MARPIALLVLVFAVALAGGAARADDLAGIWYAKETALVIHRDAGGNWVGHPIDLKAAAAVSWHFYVIDETRYRFSAISHGGMSEEKTAELEVKIEDDGRLVLPIEDAKGTAGGPLELRRLYRPLAEEVAGVQMRFIPRRDDEPSGRQYVLCSLADTFEAAVADAKKVAPELRRINVCSTVGQRHPRGRPYARIERRGLAIDSLNGVPIEACGASLVETARALAKGEGLPPPSRHYAVYATALALCFIAREEVEECHAPDLFGNAAGLPYLEWFLKERGRELPKPKTGPGWAERLADLRTTNGAPKYKGVLHVVVKPPEKRVMSAKSKAFEEKYDAPK